MPRLDGAPTTDWLATRIFAWWPLSEPVRIQREGTSVLPHDPRRRPQLSLRTGGDHNHAKTLPSRDALAVVHTDAIACA